jgi:hypothetical protein
MVAATLSDYVNERIAALADVATIAVIFDPRAALTWSDSNEYEDSRGRAWNVLRYDGNDIAFRKANLGKRTIIWVTASPSEVNEASPKITLNSMMDIWSRADLLMDASIVGVIKHIVPNETWPVGPLWEYGDILCQNLIAVQKGMSELRRYMPYPAALDVSAVRALALHCLRPDIPASAFLFRADTPRAILDNYLDLLWNGQWDEAGMSLLQKQALQAPNIALENIHDWFTLPVSQLAEYLYLRRLLGVFRVQNIANQLRGLGMLDLPVEQLETHIGRLLERWDQDSTWRTEIIRQAESVLQEDEIYRCLVLLDLKTPYDILNALAHVEAPAVIFALQSEFIRMGTDRSDFFQVSPAWLEHRNPLLARLPETPYTNRVEILTAILDNMAFIDSRRSLTIPVDADLARLLDWYVGEKLFDLEYACTRADSSVQYTPESIRPGLKKYLGGQKEWVKSFLDTIDHALANVIQINWSNYPSHPRLSTNVLWDAVKKRRFTPTEKNRLWVVVFDGMRWDTWVRHVRPRLLERFELVEAEKPYVSLLPSWTMIARTGLLSGKQPAGWKNSSGRPSRDQADLAAQLFNLSVKDRNRQLAFYSGMESDRKLEKLFASKRFPYNILVYNISDDNLHAMKGNLVELNKVVDTLLDSIVQSLTNLIEPDDTVVISSDHGFAELEEGDSISIKDDNRWQRQMDGDPNPIRYRYIMSHNLPSDFEKQHANNIFKISYPGFDEHFTVSIGRKWFRRAEARGAEDRYAHGGLSFAEMTVPGAVLKKITQKKVKPDISFEPETISLVEGETVELRVRMSNKGNVTIKGQLDVQIEPINDLITFPISLLPGDVKAVAVPVKGLYRLLPNKQVESTQSVKVTFTFKDLDGKDKKKSQRIPVTVTPRTDKVEIDFGALDDLNV